VRFLSIWIAQRVKVVGLTFSCEGTK
jgi:hypothetical protein